MKPLDRYWGLPGNWCYFHTVGCFVTDEKTLSIAVDQQVVFVSEWIKSDCTHTFLIGTKGSQETMEPLMCAPFLLCQNDVVAPCIALSRIGCLGEKDMLMNLFSQIVRAAHVPWIIHLHWVPHPIHMIDGGTGWGIEARRGNCPQLRKQLPIFHGILVFFLCFCKGHRAQS